MNKLQYCEKVVLFSKTNAAVNIIGTPKGERQAEGKQADAGLALPLAENATYNPSS